MCWILYKTITSTLDAPDMPKQPFEGRYDVVEFRVNGVVRPPLDTDELRWRRFTITPYFAAVWWMPSDEPTRYMISFEGDAMQLTSQDLAESFTFAHAGNTLVLDGTWAKSRVYVVLRERPPTLLETRGFHWISESPYNR